MRLLRCFIDNLQRGSHLIPEVLWVIPHWASSKPLQSRRRLKLISRKDLSSPAVVKGDSEMGVFRKVEVVPGMHITAHLRISGAMIMTLRQHVVELVNVGVARLRSVSVQSLKVAAARPNYTRLSDRNRSAHDPECTLLRGVFLQASQP